MITIAVVSTKGGQGKTTLCANLGALLADLGQRVLLVDADIQPSLTRFYQPGKEAPRGLTHLIRHGTATADHISQLRIELNPGAAGQVRVLNPHGRLDLIRSDDPNNELQRELGGYVNRAVRLRKALRNPVLADQYDFALVDTQGAKGPLQDAAILASELMLSPVVPDTPSSEEFVQGTLGMLRGLEGSEEIGAPVPPMVVLIYRTMNNAISRSYTQGIRNNSTAWQVRILDQAVPLAVAYLRAQALQVPVHWIDAGASEVMHHIAGELVSSLQGQVAGIYRSAVAEPVEVAQ